VVFDALLINDKPLSNLFFSERLKQLKSYMRGQRSAFKGLTFAVQLQEFYNLDDLYDYYRFVDESEFAVDGIIFMPLRWRYVKGYNKQIMKWKEPNLQSIDFLVKPYKGFHEGDNPKGSNIPVYGLFVQAKKGLVLFDITEEDLEGLEGKIVECTYNIMEKRWKYLRVREERSKPNGDWVAEGIWKCIEEDLTFEELLRYLGYR